MPDLTRFVLNAILLAAVPACPGPATGPGTHTGSGTGGVSTAACPVVGTPAAPTGTAFDTIHCPDFGCGANSPTVGDGVAFDELDSSRQQEDSHGVKIVSAIHDGISVDLKVVRHWLSATTQDDRRTLLAHRDLIGTVITVMTRRETGDLEHELKIEDVDEKSLGFWAGVAEKVPFYKITARRIQPPAPDGQKFEPICKLTVAAGEPVWAPVEHYAIAFTGDRYDAVHKTVADVAPGTTWFNLACAGTAPAKMHLMRHTNAGANGNPDYATTIEQRQAMLKMFAADDCGTGKSFTVDGQPLKYGDSKHWYPETPTTERLDPHGAGARLPFVSTIEAEWNENGVVCLDTPRRGSREEVEAACRRTIPRCGGPAGVLKWEAHVHIISANPPCAAPP